MHLDCEQVFPGELFTNDTFHTQCPLHQREIDDAEIILDVDQAPKTWKGDGKPPSEEG